MKLYSTNNPKKLYNLKDAVLSGLAPDGGLYMPQSIAKLPDNFFSGLKTASFQNICKSVTTHLVGDSLSQLTIDSIIDNSITFPAPLISLSEHISIQELFHGPSLAFKDFGAQFMARLMSHFNAQEDHELTILVATSGDTGGAVAAGFHQVPGINVIILYPKDKVSQLQQKQLTTFGDNITALEIEGTFDDCQALVKKAFGDRELCRSMRLSSANSINIARLIPQTFYYFEAFKQLQDTSNVIFSIPSGNFGNLTAGLFAKKMGLPITHFIASTNINDVVPAYLQSGVFLPSRSQETISNAMDVGNPSNFDRMLDLYGSTWNNLKEAITGYSFDDLSTIKTIQNVYKTNDYILDPHAAVALLGLLKYNNTHATNTGIILGTAHPSKFKSTLDKALNIDTPIHPDLERLQLLPSTFQSLSKEYAPFRDFLFT